MREYDITLCIFFPTPSEPTKFNPITMMTQLLQTMLKDKLSLVLCSSGNNQQIILATMPLPTSKPEFHNSSMYWQLALLPRISQMYACIGCKLLSNCTLSSIKFKSSINHLLAWLKQA